MVKDLEISKQTSEHHLGTCLREGKQVIKVSEPCVMRQQRPKITREKPLHKNTPCAVFTVIFGV
jgi:hypothetical protein